MSVIKVNNITNRDGTSGPVIAGITTVSSTSHLVVPTGSTGQRVALAPDPFINNLVLALPFNSESVFTDLSPRRQGDPFIAGITTTASLPFGVTGVTTTSVGITTFSKYYGNSVYFNGTSGNYISFPDNPDFEFASEDYTVEFWCNPSRSVSYEEIVSKGLPWQLYRDGAGTFSLAASADNGTYWTNASIGTGAVGQWHHIAVSRKGSTTYGFVNGVSGLTTSSFPIYDGTSSLVIGSYAPDLASYPYRGYIQDLRIYKGVAKYTSNFTPPNQIAL